MKYYQQGGQLQPPMQQNAPQEQGGNEEMMQILQAYFEKNQMDEQMIQQFMQEFEALPPDQQQQVIEHIVQELQGGQQEGMEQQNSPEQPMQQAPMQAGGMVFDTGYVNRLQMGKNMIRENGFNKPVWNKQFQTGAMFDENIIPFDSGDSFQYYGDVQQPPVTQHPVIQQPIIQSTNAGFHPPMLPPHTMSTTVHEDVANYAPPVSIKKVNEIADKTVKSLTSKDKEILGCGYACGQHNKIR